MGFSGGSDGKASACNVGDLGSIPGLEGKCKSVFLFIPQNALNNRNGK